MVYYILLIALLNLGLGFLIAIRLGHRYRDLVALTTESSLDSEDLDESTPEDTASLEVNDEPVSISESLDQFQDHVTAYQDQLVKIDDPLEGSATEPDITEIEESLEALKRASEEYLHLRNKTYERICSSGAETPEWDSVSESLQTVVDHQTEEIEDALTMIEQVDTQGDLHATCEEIVGKTSLLSDANHRVHEALNDVTSIMGHCEPQHDDVIDVNGTDPLTDLPSRTGLIRSLEHCWQEDPDRTRTLSAAMLEVDGLEPVYREQGIGVENQTLKSIAEMLVRESGSDATVARYAGRSFFVLFEDTDLEAAETMIQKFCESVEETPFGIEEETFRLSIRSTVLAVESNDTSESLFDRAEDALPSALGHVDQPSLEDKEQLLTTASSNVTA